jgi:hypothetical protein
VILAAAVTINREDSEARDGGEAVLIVACFIPREPRGLRIRRG